MTDEVDGALVVQGIRIVGRSLCCGRSHSKPGRNQCPVSGYVYHEVKQGPSIYLKSPRDWYCWSTSHENNESRIPSL